jgi:nicotinamidase/pyrazinamidase
MKTVFFDVDTQIDFLYPAGALYVPGAENIVANIGKLNRYAAEHGIPVVSTMDAHSENDPEFKSWPPHCVVDTVGQQKPQSTLLERRAVVPSSPAQPDITGAQQILLEKQTFDCFTNANLPALLERLKADRYVVYGVVTEICVRNAAMGLLNTGKRVELVTDAVQHLDEVKRNGMQSEFIRRGGVLTVVDQVCGEF